MVEWRRKQRIRTDAAIVLSSAVWLLVVGGLASRVTSTKLRQAGGSQRRRRWRRRPAPPPRRRPVARLPHRDAAAATAAAIPGRGAGRRPSHRFHGRHRRLGDRAARERGRPARHPSRGRATTPSKTQTANGVGKAAPVHARPGRDQRHHRARRRGLVMPDEALSDQPARHVVPVAGEMDPRPAAGWCWSSKSASCSVRSISAGFRLLLRHSMPGDLDVSQAQSRR